MKKCKLDLLKRIQDLTNWQYQKMPVLIKLSLLVLERKSKKAYKETMRQDINNIDTYENRKKINTKKWSPIYEVIDEAYIKDSNIFPEDFIRDCKKEFKMIT